MRDSATDILVIIGAFTTIFVVMSLVAPDCYSATVQKVLTCAWSGTRDVFVAAGLDLNKYLAPYCASFLR
jgi:hypothetical protein